MATDDELFEQMNTCPDERSGEAQDELARRGYSSLAPEEEAPTETTRPAFPADGVCTHEGCGANDWYDVEEGYVRMSSATFEDGVLRVFQDGWDDMGEGGDEQYVTCAVCGTSYASPENVDYAL